jgi:PLP dependent protein
MLNRKEIIIENIALILKRIAKAAKRSGRSEKDVALLAVTKNVPLEEIRVAIEAGVKIIGENKIQDAKKKFFQLGPVAEWHMIGHLQTNKIRTAAAIFNMVESIDSERVADALDRAAMQLDRQMDVLVEVNIGQEETKFGISPDKTQALANYVSRKKHLRLRGLMAMAPYVADQELSRPFFRELARLFNQLHNGQNQAWNILSMGMTHDFEIAVEEGATLVRIGTGIFHMESARRQV